MVCYSNYEEGKDKKFMRKEFSIKPVKIIEISEDFTPMKNELEKSIRRLESVKANLGGGAYGEINAAIGGVIGELEGNKKSLDNMQVVLRGCGKVYMEQDIRITAIPEETFARCRKIVEDMNELIGANTLDTEDEGENNIKEKLLAFLEQENGEELAKEYINKIKRENPDVKGFLEKLAFRESTGEYDSHRKGSPFLGRYQLGDETLQQIGFKDSNNDWTTLAESLGVHDEESYLDSKIAQEVAVLFALRWGYQYILTYGFDKYIGTKVEGIEVTESGLIAALHLVGIKDVNDAFNGNMPWEDAYDGNGVPALEYMEEMGGFDMSILWGGIEWKQ